MLISKEKTLELYKRKINNQKVSKNKLTLLVNFGEDNLVNKRVVL